VVGAVGYGVSFDPTVGSAAAEPASIGGYPVPVIAKLVQAEEDTVRDVIHRFNEIGLACLDPQRRGRPSPPSQS